MDAYELLSKRNHIHKYEKDKIPPKELIDDLLYKTWKTKSAEDVSLIMLILFITGLICWIIYGSKINSTPILVANVITFIFNFSILILKITYRDRKE